MQHKEILRRWNVATLIHIENYVNRKVFIRKSITKTIYYSVI